jgi:hypothetical protein
MKKIKNILSAIFTLMSFVAFSQSALDNQPQMADDFRANGKIYVVITVIAIIFICLAAYLVYIDLKLRKLEQKK